MLSDLISHLTSHQAPQTELNTGIRRGLIAGLLEDINLLAKDQNSNKSRLTVKGARPLSLRWNRRLIFVYPDAPQAMLALKMLGYQRAGSQMMTAPANLSILLLASTAFKDIPEASSEALRCIANGLLLIEAARATWVSKEIGGGEASVEALDVSATMCNI